MEQSTGIDFKVNVTSCTSLQNTVSLLRACTQVFVINI